MAQNPLIEKIGAAGVASTEASSKADKQIYSSIEDVTGEELLDGYVPLEGLNQDNPYILSIGESTTPSPHIRVSFRFGKGTEAQHNIYLPPKEAWTGRFFQRAHPFLGIDVPAEDLEFYLNSGVYTITVPISSIGHIVHASAAHVSRTIAKNHYGYNERIYGYLYGGSGGSMQVIGALESSTGKVWDGMVPFIVASPTSLGNFDIRLFARIVLESKAALISDAVKSGGSGNPYTILNDLESSILDEVTKLGLPLKAWENYEYLLLMHEYLELTDGLNTIGEVNEAYTTAFWNEEGYLKAYDTGLQELFLGLRERGVSEGALAKVAYHRHKDPGHAFYTWNHLRDSNGDPIYAQTPGTHYAIEISEMTSGGAKWSGNTHCKAIACVMLMDVDSFPSDGDYYRERVKESGRESDFRIWLNEYADHHETHDGNLPYLNYRLINYAGILQQALMDLSSWMEKGIEPSKSTAYEVVDSQLVITGTGADRGGIQPSVELTVNGEKNADVLLGDFIDLSVTIQIPEGTGEVVSVEWDYLGDGTFVSATFNATGDGIWITDSSYLCNKAGVFFTQVRIASQRKGDADTPFERVFNYGRVRLNVGESAGGTLHE
ncbi:MAG: hypothetical protein LBD79_00240 [Treponema sp.]|jgi:hypothetical protein|nr:hypothetical protein [Treponema sp.]